jgi:hypothetical protein
MASGTYDVKSIADLVAGFRANLTDLRDPQTSEAVVRQEYVDPFWKALGWDVANDDHRSHAEKDVLIEAPVGTIEGERVRNRRPDYLFRIDGFPRFVVEAKKPAVDLRTDKDSIFQAKTYAWSAQIPFAILTTFAELRLYDTTIKPHLEEPSRGLIEEFDLRFEDFIAQWDVLRQTFSRDAVAGGAVPVQRQGLVPDVAALQQQLVPGLMHYRRGFRQRLPRPVPAVPRRRAAVITVIPAGLTDVVDRLRRGGRLGREHSAKRQSYGRYHEGAERSFHSTYSLIVRGTNR